MGKNKIFPKQNTFLIYFLFILFVSHVVNLSLAGVKSAEDEMENISELLNLTKLQNNKGYKNNEISIRIIVEDNKLNYENEKIATELKNKGKDYFDNLNVEYQGDGIKFLGRINQNDHSWKKTKEKIKKIITDLEILLLKRNFDKTYFYTIEEHVEKRENKNLLLKENLENKGFLETKIIKNEDYISLTGFNPELKGYIKLDGRKINSQVVIKEKPGKEYKLLVGYPLIKKSF